MKKLQIAFLKNRLNFPMWADFIAIAIYLFLATHEFLKKNYDAMTAYFVVCLFIIMIIIKDKIIKRQRLLIQKQFDLMDKILSLPEEKTTEKE